MTYFRKIVHLNGKKLDLELPDDMISGDAEVLVLPIDNQNGDFSLTEVEKRRKQLERLLNGPTWSDEEVTEFEARIAESRKNWRTRRFFWIPVS